MFKLKCYRRLLLAAFATVGLFLISCSVVQGNVESRFSLAADSRLPAWLSLPPNATRDNVVVALKYLSEADNALLEMQDRQGRILNSVRAQACWHPVMREKRNSYGGFDADSYPHYRYIKLNGIVEVIEHRRMEPVFRISDDAKLKRAAIEASTCDRG